MEAVREDSNDEEYGNICSETEQKAEVHFSVTKEQTSIDSSPVHLTRKV